LSAGDGKAGGISLPQRIDGEAVYLRPIAREEAAAILRGDRVAHHLEFAQGYPGAFALEVMDIFVGERQADAIAFTPLFVVRKGDDAIVGDIGWSLPDGLEAPVVGYDIAEELWGQGLATDALRSLVKFLLADTRVDRVCADTLESHAASRRVMEKAGMSFVRAATAEVDGGLERVVYYEIARSRTER
jgi:RimJ/RimL family protein N-acetyltransferase